MRLWGNTKAKELCSDWNMNMFFRLIHNDMGGICSERLNEMRAPGERTIHYAKHAETRFESHAVWEGKEVGGGRLLDYFAVYFIPTSQSASLYLRHQMCINNEKLHHKKKSHFFSDCFFSQKIKTELVAEDPLEVHIQVCEESSPRMKFCHFLSLFNSAI